MEAQDLYTRNKLTSGSIYKYYSYQESVENLLAPVTGKTLRFNNPAHLNDPYDCFLPTKNDDQFFTGHSGLTEGLFVCSATTCPTNMLMWSHYASQHKGIVVEYDIEALYGIFHRHTGFSSVHYSSDLLVYDVNDTVTCYLDSYSGNPAVDNREKLTYDAVLTKAEDWRYESEVRAILHVGPYVLDKFKDIEIPQKAIKSIILGSRYSGDLDCLRCKVTKTINEELIFKKAQLHPDKYKIRITDI